MFTRFPEAYCAHNSVIVPTGGGSMSLAKGWKLHLPETRAGSHRRRNQLNEAIGHLFQSLAEEGRMMVQWKVIHDCSPALHGHASATEQVASAAIQRHRNRKAIHLLQAMEAGHLRREEVTVWFGQTQAGPPKTQRLDPALYYATSLEQTATDLGRLAVPLEEALAPLGARIEPMTTADIVADWHYVLNPSPASRRAVPPLPDEPAFSLTRLCAASDLHGLAERGFLSDGRYHAALTLRRLPAATFPGILDHLTSLVAVDFTLTAQVRRLAREPILASFQERHRRLQRQLASRSDPLLEETRRQLEDKIEQLARGEIVPLELELILIVHAATPEALREQVDRLKGAAAGMNRAQLYESSLAASARDLYFKTFPGCLWNQTPSLAVYAESTYAADLLPVSSSFHAHLEGAEALFTGPYGNLIGVRNFVGEGQASQPQHGLFLGKTGAGKSRFLTELLIETGGGFQHTTIIEEGLSHAPFTEAMGEKALVITADGRWIINPFDNGGAPLSVLHRAILVAVICRMIGVPKDGEKARLLHALIDVHALQLYHDFADDWLRRQSEDMRRKLARHALALHRFAAEKFLDGAEAYPTWKDEMTQDPARAAERIGTPTEEEIRRFTTKHRDAVRDFAYAHMKEYPTLSSLREHLEVAGTENPACRSAAALLAPWCRGGVFGNLFDGQSNVSLTGPVAHFELGRLAKASDDLKSVVLFLLLNVTRQHLLTLPRAWRKRVVIEEVQRLLGIPGGEELLRELFAQFRKFNVQCLSVCQQVSQLDETLRSAILGNVRMAFIFHPGDAKDLDLLAEHLPLSEAAKAMILRYPTPDQLRGSIYSECCYLHLTSQEPHCGTIRFTPLPEN